MTKAILVFCGGLCACASEVPIGGAAQGLAGFGVAPATCDENTDFTSPLIGGSVFAYRAEAQRHVWGGGLPIDLPTVTTGAQPPFDPWVTNSFKFTLDKEFAQRIDIWDHPIFTHTIHIYHLVPQESIRQYRAVLLHDGHSTYFAHPISHFLADGYDLIYVSMPGYEPNSFPPEHYRDHNQIGTDFPGLRLFLEPSVIAANQAEAEGLETTAMMGLSGGGWTTTTIALVDPRWEYLAPFAGSVPTCLHNGEAWDYEKLNDFWSPERDYLHAYYMGGFGRKMHVFYNLPDPNSYNPEGREPIFEAYAQGVRDALGEDGEFDMTIIEHSQGHQWIPEVYGRIQQELTWR